MEKVTVRVPATTANLAAGFDVLGCALGLYNKISFTPADTLSFSGCPEEFRNEENLAYVAYVSVWKHLKKEVPPVHIHIEADVPVCRGLGSSAALIAGGAMAANIMAGSPYSREELLAITTIIEGHPDNLAPALLGGLTASMMDGEKVYSVRYQPHAQLRFVALSPDFPLSTHEARSVLPKSVPYADAVRNGGYLAVLLRALEQGDEALISVALRDHLHQPYRRKLIHEFDAVEKLANKNGCHAVCVSGAGPTLLCITRDPAFAEKMREDVKSLKHGWTVRDLPVDHQGVIKLYE